jgi:hypothetical protein
MSEDYTYQPIQTTAQMQARIRDLEAQLNAANAKLDAVPVDAIIKLRTHLSDDGKYSICREDGEKMFIGETIMLGDLFAAIDTWLDAPQAAQP